MFCCGRLSSHIATLRNLFDFINGSTIIGTWTVNIFYNPLLLKVQHSVYWHFTRLKNTEFIYGWVFASLWGSCLFISVHPPCHKRRKSGEWDDFGKGWFCVWWTIFMTISFTNILSCYHDGPPWCLYLTLPVREFTMPCIPKWFPLSL